MYILYTIILLFLFKPKDSGYVLADDWDTEPAPDPFKYED